MDDTRRTLKFKGIDDWNRPVFKDDNGNYYGNTDILFGWEATGEQVLEKINEDMIYYFGKSFGCEPDGSKIKSSAIKLIP